MIGCDVQKGKGELAISNSREGSAVTHDKLHQEMGVCISIKLSYVNCQLNKNSKLL